MSDITFGSVDLSAMRGYLRLQRGGNWQGRWVMAGDQAPDGVFSGSFWGERFTGYAKRTGAPYLQAQVYTVGGRGNLGSFRTVKPKDYRYVSFAQIARELIQDAGEVVAEDVLVGGDQQLVGWTRFEGPWISELERLIATRNDPNDINDGTTWKVRLSDGQIEIRPLVEQDTAPEVEMLADRITERLRIYALDDETQGLVIKPGDRFDGIVADTVEYKVEPEALRVNVFYHPIGQVGADGQRTLDPSQNPYLDRIAALWQGLFDVGMARYRDTNIDPIGYYMGTVSSVRGNGDVDIVADDARIGYVNDVEVFSGLPGWQVKPVPQSKTPPVFPGARVLFGWAGGNKTKKCCIAWGGSPENSLDTATIQARTLVEFKVPTHRVVGDAEVVDGDSRTEHDVGIGTELTAADVTLGAATGLGSAVVLGISGTDGGFTVRIQADTSANPPPTGGLVATVNTSKTRAWKKVPNTVIVCGADDGATAAVNPGGYGSQNDVKITVGKGLTKSGIYRFSVYVRE